MSKRMKLTSTLLVAAALVLPSQGVLAEEKNVEQADVPRVVVESVQKKYPSGRVVQFVEVKNEDGTTYYEAWMAQEGNRQVAVHVLPSGEIITEETKLIPDDSEEQSDTPDTPDDTQTDAPPYQKERGQPAPTR
jgi:hypothetical protein